MGESGGTAFPSESEFLYQGTPGAMKVACGIPVPLVITFSLKLFLKTPARGRKKWLPSG